MTSLSNNNVLHCNVHRDIHWATSQCEILVCFSSFHSHINRYQLILVAIGIRKWELDNNGINIYKKKNKGQYRTSTFIAYNQQMSIVRTWVWPPCPDSSEFSGSLLVSPSASRSSPFPPSCDLKPPSPASDEMRDRHDWRCSTEPITQRSALAAVAVVCLNGFNSLSLPLQ